MVSKFPEFMKLDCHDVWLEDCSSLCSHQNHNLRKNAAMLPWSAMDMNWCDFLEALEPWTATLANANPLASFAQGEKIAAASSCCVLRHGASSP